MQDATALAYLRDNLQGHRIIEDQIIGDTGIHSTLVSLASSSKIESLEKYQSSPNRTEQTAHLFSCKSFCDYINRFSDVETTCYLDVEAGQFAAVLDHYGNELTSWCDHRALFQPKQSIQWQAWLSIHKKPLSQIQLAMFIEENLDAITTPEPNTMLKAALDFQSNENLTLKSATNLNDGSSRFTFTKDNASQTVEFPHRIKLTIPLHSNEEARELEGRIRYRTNSDGVLVFTFSFVQNPEAIQRDAMLRLAETIRVETKDIYQYEGQLKGR